MTALPRPQVVAINCPLWHPYDHGNAWKGEGWCEYELLKTAPPRFPGHVQPLEPQWGLYDESDPAWQAREIDLAADHGIDVMLFDWYWYSGVRLMEETLERGFLQAPNRHRLKFALMWANHPWADYFPPSFGHDWHSWLPMRHSRADLFRVIDYAAKTYFNQPNYWRVAGRLFLSVFAPASLIQALGGPDACRQTFADIDAHLDAQGLPPMHFQAMLDSDQNVELVRQAGFLSTGNYNVVTSGKTSANLTQTYDDLIDAHQAYWSAMARSCLPNMPVVTMGWDVTARCEHRIPWPFPPDPRTGKHAYPYMHVVLGNTPERFERLCRLAGEQARLNAAAQIAAHAPPTCNAVIVNSWNEWTEGSYLLPEKRTGLAYLQGLKRALG